MRTLDIISPVFREEATIEAFHAALDKAVEPLAPTYAVRFIYVVDPSADRTEAILADIASRDPRSSVVVMARRFGHQAALVAGIDASDGDAVVMLDSDLQHPPELIVEMVRRWEAGADIVQTLRQDGDETARAKRTTSRWFYQLLGKISTVELQSGAADYRLLSRRVADIFRRDIREHNPFLRGLIGWVGFTVSYLPFQPAKRHAGRSKYSVSTLFSFAVNGFCSFSKLPLRMCVMTGLAVSIISFLGGILYTVLYFLGNESVPGWASIFVLTSIAVGLNMLFLGIIGEYVGLIFDEVKARPRYIVRQTYGTRPLPAPPMLGGVPASNSRQEYSVS